MDVFLDSLIKRLFVAKAVLFTKRGSKDKRIRNHKLVKGKERISKRKENKKMRFYYKYWRISTPTASPKSPRVPAQVAYVTTMFSFFLWNQENTSIFWFQNLSFAKLRVQRLFWKNINGHQNFRRINLKINERELYMGNWWITKFFLNWPKKLTLAFCRKKKFIVYWSTTDLKLEKKLWE